MGGGVDRQAPGASAGTKRGIDENSSNAENAENVVNRRKKAELLKQHVTPYPYDGSESDSTTEQTCCPSTNAAALAILHQVIVEPGAKYPMDTQWVFG